MSKRVLITGASGFLGYHLIQAALEHNFEVFAAVRQSSKIDHLKTSQVTFTYPDLSCPTQLEENFRTNKYDYIIHAAGSTKARRKEEYEMINAAVCKKCGHGSTRVGFGPEEIYSGQ
jgi:UDP-glucose 4-epimerase